MELGARFFMKEAKERASGAVKRDWEPRLIEARYLGQHARTGAMMVSLQTELFVVGLGVDCPKQNVGIKQVGKISKEYRGTCDQQACRNLKSILWPNQAQPRQNEEKEYERNEPNSTRRLHRSRRKRGR